MRIGLMLAAAALAGGLGTCVSAEERISIGTGGTGGLFYVIGAGVADVINKHAEGMTARAEVTGASVENLRRVAAGQMQIGFSSSSTLYEAATGTGAFDGNKQAVQGIASLYPAVLQVATIAGTGIAGFEDLKGKRINLGPPGSNAAVLAQRLLDAYGVFDPGKAQFLSYTEGVAALGNGTLDATVVLAGAPTASLIDLATQEDMVLLPIDPDRLSDLFANYPYYQPAEIPAGTYKGQDTAVAAINDPATLFAGTDVDPATVQAITAAIFDHLDELSGVHPQAKAISVESATPMPVELHPGAKAYFDGKS
ncbi:TAXI family TRAP transporter solute-binding subunit [Frigidibacter sp. MR17.14]|uniref:TAXI family TRAP transporter solute-binding subunit n=1 Tax=Frigidibacter sp. MR17.14 TaxID=3126509 RepID=UPI0030130572